MDYRYTAIVLRKREVGETDRLYTFYTREAGKLQAIAKGVRKPEAKLASSLETLSQGEIMVVRTRGIGKIAGAYLEESYPLIRHDYNVLTDALEAIALFDRLVDLDEYDEDLYHLLSTFLSRCEQLMREQKQEKIPLIKEAFLYKLLAHLGYQLELGVCIVSGAKLSSDEIHFLSPSRGGVVRSSHASELRDTFPVSENMLKLLRLFYQHPLEKLEKLIASPKDIAKLAQFRKVFLASFA